MDRKAEILAVKQLGEQMGYGNLMDIASALWAVKLDKSVGTDEGAFLPVALSEVKRESKNYYSNRKDAVKKDVLSI